MALKTVIFLVCAAALVGGAAHVWLTFRADMTAARAALDAHDTVTVETSFGPVQLVDTGQGFPVLSIHGTGGGFDQGLALAADLRAAGYRILAPSRFGYLGTPVPKRNDAMAQADALAEMLDGLGVRRAVVAGASAGAITALAFAARHPERTAALVLLVPAYYPPAQAAPAPWSATRTRVITAALRSDFLFWAGLRLFPAAMASTILATDESVIAAASPAEKARIDATLAMILPISARAEGLMLDARNTAAPPKIDLGAIRAPTFIAAAEDDHYRTAESARLLARGIVGARLLITPDGGHVWVNRSAEVQAAVAAFLHGTEARK